jgi:hypothetical protein
LRVNSSTTSQNWDFHKSFRLGVIIAVFSGPPFQILAAWREGRVQLIISPEILEEYSG